MSTVRVKREKDFTIIQNDILRSNELSLKAKGLICYLLSHDEDFKIYKSSLSNHLKEGKDAINNAWKELKDAGYIESEKVTDDKGRISYNHTVYDVPVGGFSYYGEPDTKNTNIRRLNKEKEMVKEKGGGSEKTGKEFQQKNSKQNVKASTLQNDHVGRDSEVSSACITIVSYLNEKTGKSYRPTTGATKRKISARLREGYTVDEFKKVIDNKCEEWLSDHKMKDFLRPSTLFAASHFDDYLNQSSSSEMFSEDTEIVFD